MIARTTFLATILLSLGGCVTASGPIPPTLSNKSMVVISTLSNDLQLQYVGSTVFHNKTDTFDATDWRLRANLQTSAIDAINANGKFQARPPTVVDPHLHFEGVGYDAANTPIYRISKRKQMTRSYAEEENADLVLLIAPVNYKDVFFGTSQTVSGYGIYERSFMGLKRAVTFATLQLVLYDGANGDEIAWVKGYGSTERPTAEWMGPDHVFEPNAEHETRSTIRNLYKSLLSDLLGQIGL